MTPRFTAAILAASLAVVAEGRDLAPVPEGKVRVAAVQCYSRMGETAHNRTLLTRCIERAARAGAKIVVTPECAAQGYMDPGRDKVWSQRLRGEGRLAVRDVAEPVPGPSTRYFGQLAKRLGIYLVVGLVEAAEGRFHNSQVLLGPDGRLRLHHRKQKLWPPGDGLWVTAGTRPLQTLDTPYGRLGLMICYEVHKLPRPLGEAGVDIVLYSIGWFGPNTRGWYTDTFPRKYVAPNGFAIVCANWSADKGAPGWEGIGYSCIIDRDGTVLAMARSERGAEVVLADLPIRHRAKASRE
ncbi:MAG: carbon-nitrogen hydrolase family protein [Planctomycetota bacterium]